MSDGYAHVLYNFLLNFYLEDHDYDELEDENLNFQMKQIKKYYEKEFNKLVDPIRNKPNAGELFAKLFPKPEPRPQD